MLGGLAKRLRAAGHDAYYAGEGTDVSDGALTRKALREGRVLLTGDGGFLDRRPVRDGPQLVPRHVRLHLVHPLSLRSPYSSAFAAPSVSQGTRADRR